MSTYTQDTTKNTGFDIVQLTNNGNNVVPITTAEAVVWHEDDGDNMTLRDKIESLNFTPGETTTKYTGGQGIGIDNNTINVLVDNETIEFNAQNELQVKDLTDQISSALSNYLGPNTLIKTEISTKLPSYAKAEPNTLYLIGSNNNSGDSFEEYIWIVDEDTNNGGYFEKLGTTEFAMNKLEEVYGAVFYTPTSGESGNKILDNTASIEGIKNELGNTNDDKDKNTIYGKLKNLETNCENIAGLSFEPTGYELKYTYEIDDLYKNTTTN